MAGRQVFFVHLLAFLKPLFLIYALLLLRMVSPAQNNSAIPEIKTLPKHLPTSVYSDTLFRIAIKYKDVDALQAINIWKQVIDSATKIGYTKLIIQSNNQIGLVKGEQNQLAEAYQYHQSAFKLASQTNDSSELATTYNYIGNTYKRLGLQKKGVQYVKRAVVIARLIGDSANVASFSDRLGHIYMDWAEESNIFNNYFEALKNYKYSLHINEARNDLLRLSISYINLANAYLVMYKHGGDKSFLRQSISYSIKGQEYANAGNHQLEWAINTLNLGEAYYLLDDFKTSLEYFDQCLPLFKNLSKRMWYAVTLVDIALVYEKKKDYDKAIDFIKKANSISLDYQQVEPYSNYKYLAEIYAGKKDYKAAYEANKKYYELFNRDLNTRTMLEMEGKQLELDIERKDKEIELLNEENKYNAIQHERDITVKYALFAFSGLLIVVLILMFNRSRLLKRSKELSDHARKMQQQFLANTSHEIRTPMNGIIGMANQLEHTELNQEQRNNLLVIKKSANSLLNIINDVLDLSKIQAGRIEFQDRKFLLDDFLDDIYKLLRNQALEKGLEFKFSIDDKMPQVLCGDDGRLKQILINVLSNAIKFTQKGSVHLKVSLEKKVEEKHFVNFTIADTGIGIPLKKQHEIFESFVQLENQGQRTQGGTGLGLAITKSLVELQNGSITIKSRVAKGSTFEIIIPFKVVDLNALLTESENAAHVLKGDRNLKGISILVVEDNLVNQQVIAKILERWNAEYSIAATAVEGFELLNEQPFDIILMDIELPVINGWEATQYIRSKFPPPVSSLPILALTAYAYDSEKQKCIECGMNDVLIKPYSEEELYLKIREFLFNEKYTAPVQLKSNIEELEQRYSDDKPALQELYELFLLEMPEYISEMENLKGAENSDALSKLAHKMKSPVSLVGGAETIDVLRRLNSDKNLDGAMRATLVNKAIKDCRELIKTITGKLNGLKN